MEFANQQRTAGSRLTSTEVDFLFSPSTSKTALCAFYKIVQLFPGHHNPPKRIIIFFFVSSWMGGTSGFCLRFNRGLVRFVSSAARFVSISNNSGFVIQLESICADRWRLGLAWRTLLCVDQHGVGNNGGQFVQEGTKWRVVKRLCK
jgi:hypothetical protein